jgi:hypothetical protein
MEKAIQQKGPADAPLIPHSECIAWLSGSKSDLYQLWLKIELPFFTSNIQNPSPLITGRCEGEKVLSRSFSLIHISLFCT